MEYDVFISYKRKGGSGWAEMLRLAFVVYRNMPKERIYMDVHNCGTDWKADLENAIKNANNVIVIISKDFENQINVNQSEDVWLYELKLALHYRRNIIPFVVDDIKKEDIQKISDDSNIPLPLSDILHKNTWIMYDHDYPDNSINRIELKDEKDMSVKITFTSFEYCDLLIPAIGDNPQCYICLNDENKRSHSIPLNINFDKELKFEANRRVGGERVRICYHVFFEEYKDDLKLGDVKNSISDVYCEIKNREDCDIDIDWDWGVREKQIVLNDLSFQADLMNGREQNLMNVMLQAYSLVHAEKHVTIPIE